MSFTNNKDLKTIGDEQKLWRYTDLAKFVDLIQRRSLFFSSLKLFEKTDPWEGLLPPANVRPRRPDEQPKEWFPLNISKKFRHTFFVNCWHMNDDESDSQWKIYGESVQSLAIVSSFGRLKKSLKEETEVFGSSITYYDRQSTIPVSNVFFPVTYKRKAFEHEREFRLIIWDRVDRESNAYPDHVFLKVDISQLIEKIIVSPRAEFWLVSLIETFLKNQNFEIPIIQSDLLKLPVYPGD